MNRLIAESGLTFLFTGIKRDIPERGVLTINSDPPVQRSETVRYNHGSPVSSDRRSGRNIQTIISQCFITKETTYHSTDNAGEMLQCIKILM